MCCQMLNFERYQNFWENILGPLKLTCAKQDHFYTYFFSWFKRSVQQNEVDVKQKDNWESLWRYFSLGLNKNLVFQEAVIKVSKKFFLQKHFFSFLVRYLLSSSLFFTLGSGNKHKAVLSSMQLTNLQKHKSKSQTIVGCKNYLRQEINFWRL